MDVEEKSGSPVSSVVLEATGTLSGLNLSDTPAREDAPNQSVVDCGESGGGRVLRKCLSNSDVKTDETRDEITTPIDVTGRVETFLYIQSHSAIATHTSCETVDKTGLEPQNQGLSGAIEVNSGVEVASSNNTECGATTSALEVGTSSLKSTMASTCGPDDKSERLSSTYLEAVEKDTKDDVLCEARHAVTISTIPDTISEEPPSPLTELSSESASNDGSDRNDCFSDATSSDTSEHLYFDFVVPPPFNLSKEIYPPMKDVCPNAVSFEEGGSQTGCNSEPSSTGHTSCSGKSVDSRLSSPLPQLTEDSNYVDDKTFKARQWNPKSASSGRKRKLRHRSRSRSRSPLHLYEEEEALNLFGPTLMLYSVGGPPGGFPIGVATLQCPPEAGAHANFNLNVDNETQRRLVEARAEAAAELEQKLSQSAPPRRRSSKLQSAKCKGTESIKANIAMQSGKLGRERDGEYSEKKDSPSGSSSEEIASSMVRNKSTTSRTPKKRARKKGRRPRATNLILSNVQDSDRKTCHQCRNRNVYAKMYCNSIHQTGRTCTTAYCHRCISTRYPDFLFIPEGSFTCFRCLNSCSCDICTRRRGEDYIKSSRMHKAATENPSSRSILVAHHQRMRPNLQSAKVKSEGVTEIGEDAKEWIHSHRFSLNGNGQDNNEMKGRARAFVGAWQPFWGSMKDVVEMESAVAECEPTCLESSRGSKSYLYVGRPISVRRPLEALNGTIEATGSILTMAQSRSGRTIRPSEKVKQYRDGSDDEFSSPQARKKRRKLVASSARSSTLSSLSDI